MPATSIYSRADGIVNWRTCLLRSSDTAENIEVYLASHTGLGVNAAALWAVADRLLSSRRFMEGDQFTLADIAIGAYARRWLGVEGITRPAQPNLTRWLAELGKRPGFAQFVAPPMS